VCFVVSVDLEVEESEIVLDVGQVTLMLRQFEMIACCGVFY
jgi:hypothetical protein